MHTKLAALALNVAAGLVLAPVVALAAAWVFDAMGCGPAFTNNVAGLLGLFAFATAAGAE